MLKSQHHETGARETGPLILDRLTTGNNLLFRFRYLYLILNCDESLTIKVQEIFFTGMQFLLTYVPVYFFARISSA